MHRSSTRTSSVAHLLRLHPIAWVLCLLAGVLGPLAVGSAAWADVSNPVVSLTANPTALNVGGTDLLTATVTPFGLLSLGASSQVTFTVIAGPNAGLSIPGCTLTGGLLGGNNVCTTSYTSSLAGTDTIQAGAVGQTSAEPTVQVTWNAVPAFLFLDPANIAFATTGLPAPVTATVFDGRGAPVAGDPVSFVVTGAGATSATVTTDGSGNALFTFTSAVTGTSSVVASTGPGGSITAHTSIRWAGPPATIALSQSVNGNIAPVNGTDTVSANVQDASGSAVGDGTQVTFQVTGAATQTVTATTSGGGASFSFGSLVTGTSVVTATAGPASASVTVTWENPVATYVFMSPGGAVQTIGKSQLVITTVLDQFGNAVAGALVRFRLNGVNAQQFTSSAPTGGNGQAGFQYTGNNIGLDTLTSWVDFNNNAVQDPGEPGTSIQIAWTQKPGQGYWLVARDGGIFAFGPSAANKGSMGGQHLNQPIVGMAATPSGQGYWLVASDGGIFAFGDAHFWGSTGSIHLNQPIVGMARTPSGLGYWLVASDGGIFAFGDAHFWGSTGSIHLNKPIVGMAAAPDGQGYWLVASDGGIFAFGSHIGFFGSTGSINLNSPIVGMTPTSDGQGYWFVAGDGGVFAFGDAPSNFGSLGGGHIPAPIVAMGEVPDDSGYYLTGADGSVYPFPVSVRSFGSMAGVPLNAPIVGMAVAP